MTQSMKAFRIPTAPVLFTLLLLLVEIIFPNDSSAQNRLFPSGTGRPSSAQVLLNRPPHTRPLAPLNLDVVWEKILTNRSYETSSGGITRPERNYFMSADKNSPEFRARKSEALSRFLRTYASDLKAAPMARLPSLEIMNELKNQGMDVSLKAVENSQMTLKALTPKSGKTLAAEMRARLVGKGTKGKLFAAVDVLLMASAGWKAKNDFQADQDINSRVCPTDPSDLYVEKVMLQDQSVQQEIFKSCEQETALSSPKNLRNKISQKRHESLNHFSAGKSTCKYDGNGMGVIEVIGDQGTKQILMFDEDHQLKTVRVLPQNMKFMGSFLEYTGFPDHEKVRYTGIQRPSSQQPVAPDFSMAQFENEDLLSFATRIKCTTEGCSGPGDQTFLGITQFESPLNVTSRKPFGDIQQNSDFFVQAAKTLGYFRQGIEQNDEAPMTFNEICHQTGSTPPTETPARGNKKDTQPKLKKEHNTTR